ncbi:hypothetical protein FSARC_6967 [Fusarium sarcochroum]|uniref:Uncharacterized protein n=1 Tax=Fusarium sarcochroum TaxID=1208366 RepID=A0A8H4TW50_9HYPO|nr:hypothetical protein FSARC_6967 [Fusarium sarcochroum]
MLPQLPVPQPLDDPSSIALIRTCTLSSHSSVLAAPDREQISNLKKDDEPLNGGSLEFSPACMIDGEPTSSKLGVSYSGGDSSTEADHHRTVTLLESLIGFFKSKDNYDENFLFVYPNNRREHTSGISVDMSGDLAAVQKSAFAWSKCSCGVISQMTKTGFLPGVQMNGLDSDTSMSDMGSPVTPTRFLTSTSSLHH